MTKSSFTCFLGYFMLPPVCIDYTVKSLAAFYLWNKSDWFTSSSCSCRSTNTMNIILAICWPKNRLDCARLLSIEQVIEKIFWIFYNLHVIIYNTIDVWNIETTSGHIRAYQNTSWFSLESTQSSQSFLLTHLSMPKSILSPQIMLKIYW